MNERIRKYISGLKNGKTILVLGIVGVLLVFLSSFLTTSEKKTAPSVDFDINSYKQGLEKDITNLVKDITGHKGVTVVITLDSGIKYNYADETKSGANNRNSDSQTESSSDSEQNRVIITDSSGNEKALIVNEELPQIRGVAVVYSGANNEVTNEKVKNALMATLSITSKRIYISGKGGIQ